MDIFIKHTDKEYEEAHRTETKVCIKYDELVDTIPEDHYAEEKKEKLIKGICEWRWRFFKFNNGIKVEISCKKFGGDRMFVSRNGSYKKCEIDPIYDQYVVRKYYCYVKEDSTSS